MGDLQTAINQVSPGGMIWVAAGTYLPTETRLNNSSGPNDRYNTFHISKNIKLYGGFAGTETMLEQRNWKMNPTILSGDLDTVGKVEDNAYHIAYMDGTTMNGSVTNACVIDGFLFEYGNADGPFPEDLAGAIYMDGSGSTNGCSPVLRNIIFRHNSTRGWAGAVYCDGSDQGLCNAKIENCVFWDNHANYGGAIYNFGYNGTCNPEITNCTFFDNWAVSGGGAVRNFGPGNVGIFTNSIFWKNGDGISNVVNGTATTVNYSILDDGNQNGIVNLPIGASGNHNLDSFPEFVDTSTGNLRIRRTSNAIDSGDDSAISVSEDLDKRIRKNGNVDIGAFENPWIHCPDTVILNEDYSPFKGMYEAGSMISVENGTGLLDITLSAPVIEIEILNIELGTLLSLYQTGCP